MRDVEAIQIDEFLTVGRAKDEYPALFKTFKFFVEAEDYKIATLVSIAVGVCPYCFEEPRGCPCMNDC